MRGPPKFLPNVTTVIIRLRSITVIRKIATKSTRSLKCVGDGHYEYAKSNSRFRVQTCVSAAHYAVYPVRETGTTLVRGRFRGGNFDFRRVTTDRSGKVRGKLYVVPELTKRPFVDDRDNDEKMSVGFVRRYLSGWELRAGGTIVFDGNRGKKSPPISHRGTYRTIGSVNFQ